MYISVNSELKMSDYYYVASCSIQEKLHPIFADFEIWSERRYTLISNGYNSARIYPIMMILPGVIRVYLSYLLAKNEWLLLCSISSKWGKTTSNFVAVQNVKYTLISNGYNSTRIHSISMIQLMIVGLYLS